MVPKLVRDISSLVACSFSCCKCLNAKFSSEVQFADMSASRALDGKVPKLLRVGGRPFDTRLKAVRSPFSRERVSRFMMFAFGQ